MFAKRANHVKRSNEPKSSDHVGELMVPYLEERLSPGDRDKVLEHLSVCPECMSETESLRSLIGGLSNNRTVFCPSPRELFELVRTGRDPEGSVAEHLKECSMCRDELASLRSLKSDEAMAQDLWEKVKNRLPEPVHPVRFELEAPSVTNRLWEFIFGWFKIPAIAGGALAAVLLIFIIFYPADVPPTMMGLSSTTWEKAPRPKLGPQGGEQRVAFVVFFHDFQNPIPQKKVDALYQALEPDMELIERYQVISPAMVREAVRKKQVNSDDPANVPEALHKNLAIGITVVVNVSERRDGIHIVCRMIDAATGAVLRSNEDVAANLNDLGAAVRRNVMGLLLSS